MSARMDSDDQVFCRIRSALTRARATAEKAQAAEQVVFKLLEDACIDPQAVPTSAENADNLEEAISCYLNYGEYSISGLMKEIRGAYGMGERGDE